MCILPFILAAASAQAPPTPVPCDVALDLTLVLDGSGSVRDKWAQVEQFTVQAIESFNISEAGAHIAVTEFSSGDPKAWVVCPYPNPPVCGLMDDKDKLVTMARNMFNAGYGTAIGAGIDVGQGALNTGPLARPSSKVKKVLLVLTDGNNNFPPDPAVEAANARAAGTEIYVVGVGTKRNLTTLTAIASTPTDEHLFMADNFTAALDALHNATQNICNDKYVCVDDAVCEKAQPGQHGVSLKECNTTCGAPPSPPPVTTYVCVDDAVCMKAKPGQHGTSLKDCNTTCGVPPSPPPVTTYVCVDDAVCEKAQPGQNGTSLKDCNTTCGAPPQMYVCVDDSVCEKAQPGQKGTSLKDCKSTCHDPKVFH